ncbi:hypothetical protein QTG56_25670 (plasmid) [Rossellomorea sp. AcN35-11]|nr:hypothetical protein [Rossellomorea aquimaris]WJV32005.1 hypothetical protein QTG56_25670 [Rossellomorea sp. AcN35-11]
MYKAPIEECPHCQSASGFYSKIQVTGSSVQRYHYDGSEADNTELYAHLNHKESKYAYCLDCNKRLFEMDEVEEVY